MSYFECVTSITALRFFPLYMPMESSKGSFISEQLSITLKNVSEINVLFHKYILLMLCNANAII